MLPDCHKKETKPITVSSAHPDPPPRSLRSLGREFWGYSKAGQSLYG